MPAFGGKNNPNLQPLGEPAPAPVEKEKPNYGASGLLAAEQNSFKGVVVKYAEPPEARKPTKKWRLYVFKGKEELGV